MRLTSARGEIKRLLITRHDKIGDFVLALPLCKAIKHARPDIELTVLVSRVNYEFAKALPFIDHVLLYTKDFWQSAAELRDCKFNASISCYIDTRLGALLTAAGIPIRLGPATKFAQVFFNHQVVQRRSKVEKKEWEYNIDLGKALFPDTPFDATPPLIQFAHRTLKNRAVFHIGSGGSSDGNLRLEDYLWLAKEAAAIPGLEVVFTFGPEDEQAYRQVSTQLTFPATLLRSTMTLIEFCQYLAESKIFISTSTGPMHLAGAVNTPTLSFFGNSKFASSLRWATISEPQRQQHVMLDPDYSPTLLPSIKDKMFQALALTEHHT